MTFKNARSSRLPTRRPRFEVYDADGQPSRIFLAINTASFKRAALDKALSTRGDSGQAGGGNHENPKPPPGEPTLLGHDEWGYFHEFGHACRNVFDVSIAFSAQGAARLCEYPRKLRMWEAGGRMKNSQKLPDREPYHRHSSIKDCGGKFTKVQTTETCGIVA